MGKIPGGAERRNLPERPRKVCACGATKKLIFSEEHRKWFCPECKEGIHGI